MTVCTTFRPNFIQFNSTLLLPPPCYNEVSLPRGQAEILWGCVKLTYVLFLFNIGVVSIRCICLAGFLFLWRHTRKRLFFWCAFLSFALLVEVLLLYMSEFLPGFAVFYNSQVHSEPITRSALIAAYLISYCMLLAHGLCLPLRRLDRIIFAGLFCLIPLVSLARLTPFSNFLYNSATWAYIFYTFILGIRACGSCPLPPRRRRLVLLFLWAVLLLQILYYIETLIWIQSSQFLPELYFPELGQRSIFSALLGILLDTSSLAFVLYILFHIRISPPQAANPIPPDYHTVCAAYRLTPREEEILVQLMENRKNTEIAQALYISPGTVKSHIHNIFTKFEVKSREELKEKVARVQPAAERGTSSSWQAI